MVLESGFQNGFLIVPTEHRRHRTDEPWQEHCYSVTSKIAMAKHVTDATTWIH